MMLVTLNATCNQCQSRPHMSMFVTNTAPWINKTHHLKPVMNDNQRESPKGSILFWADIIHDAHQ